MSFQVTTAFVAQFKANVELLSQQKGSRFRSYVRVEDLTGEEGFYEQIGATAAQKKTGRHSDTPLVNTPHARRRVTPEDYVWADLIDNEDKVRMLIDPTGPYAVNANHAFNRSIDDEIIDAALRTSYTGKKGTTPVDLPASQVVPHGSAGLTVDKLTEARNKFWAADVDEEIPLYIAVTGNQMVNLLKTTEVTSADYNTVKTLVKGEIDTFMGFKFIRSQRIQKDAGDAYRRCIAWAHDGILLAVNRDISTDIGPRRDKNIATQVHLAMTVGATRMEEVKVVEVQCTES